MGDLMTTHRKEAALSYGAPDELEAEERFWNNRRTQWPESPEARAARKALLKRRKGK
jgi:hypothetical protein